MMQSDLNFRNLRMKNRLEKERVKKEAKKMIMSTSRDYDPKELNFLIIRDITASKKFFDNPLVSGTEDWLG